MTGYSWLASSFVLKPQGFSSDIVGMKWPHQFPTYLVLVIGCSALSCQSPQVTDSVIDIVDPTSLIPAPSELHVVGGFTGPVNHLMVHGFDACTEASQSWIATWFADLGLSEQLANRGEQKTMVKASSHLWLDNNQDFAAKEGSYDLHIKVDGVALRFGDQQGLMNGLQTLRQLTPADFWSEDFNGSLKPGFHWPLLQITDRPLHAYRGMHLDVCRHFFDVIFIKKYLDNLAFHKFNRFHWHLTEDQGWRIAIEAYPLLTDVGAWRAASQIGPYSDQRFDSTTYGGFYSQDDILEVVAYATSLGIEVIPEIELPGHSRAAIAAYPWLSCQSELLPVATGWGVFEDVYCAGKDSVFDFLTTVLDEVMDLFPSKVIHIGGDESPKARWETCAACQQRMVAEGLDNEHQLQSYFIQRIEKHVNQRGRDIIGWDEILEGGLAPNAKVMSWRGEKGGLAAASMGHEVVMTPGKPLYFDHYQSDPSQEPHAIGGHNSLWDVYAYQPLSNDSSVSAFIIGAQGNVWTEYMETPEHVEYMVQPRASALAEILWSGARDSATFDQALQYHAQRMDQLHWNQATHHLHEAH